VAQGFWAFFMQSVLCFIVFYSALSQTNAMRFIWHGRTAEETKWDSDNGCVYKIYIMSEIFGWGEHGW